MTQPPAPPKVFRFDARRRIVVASAVEAQLSRPARVLVVLLGLVFVAFGLGMAALLAHILSPFRQDGLGSMLAAFLFLFVFVGIAAYGCDLIGRGVTGRQWSRRFWNTFEDQLYRRAPIWGLVLAVAVLVVLAVGPLFANGPDRFAGLMFLAALSVQLFGHELGHLVAAAAVGYRPRWLSAGPLIVRVEGGRTRLTRSRSWWMFFGGYAAYEPLGRTRAKDLVVIAAGPLANLLLAEAARETWGWPTDSTVVSLFLRALIGLGIALAVLNLMPLPRTAGGLALDGRELLDLLRRRF